MLQGRDNLFERMHGLPKVSKEEEEARRKKYKTHVDFKEFLPNSVLKSPIRKMNSHTVTTQRLQLYKMDK